MADPPTPGSPSSGRHKIFARRVLTTLIKAPCILPAVIRSNVKHLETPAENHQPTKTSGPPLNHGTLAPLSLDYPTLSQELQYELSAWFHELQWKHARRKNNLYNFKSFPIYVQRTHDTENSNMVLLAIPLTSCNNEYKKIRGLVNRLPRIGVPTPKCTRRPGDG
ncbi:hypothetical protein H4Q26_009703 [Puccinia striiformis f. sp. tritici PST-130]|nr:hypothetical protein H4Q26_009703 [Puccinia striiformis f. sp. tritici PST-130]